MCNVVVLITKQITYIPLHKMSTKKTRADSLNLYNSFPFKLGLCGKVEDVILLDEWVFENNGRFSENAHLYPAKVPNNLMSCPLKWELQE